MQDLGLWVIRLWFHLFEKLAGPSRWQRLLPRGSAVYTPVSTHHECRFAYHVTIRDAIRITPAGSSLRAPIGIIVTPAVLVREADRPLWRAAMTGIRSGVGCAEGREPAAPKATTTANTTTVSDWEDS